MKPIQVFVRHCYYSSNSDLPSRQRPEWFSKDACWKNLWDTIELEIADVHVIYDAHFGPLRRKYPDANFRMMDCGSEAGSFLAMLEIIKDKMFPPDTIIYMVEDDYLHRAGWCGKLLEAFTLPIHYATLYDHADKYGYYPDLKSQVFATATCHWRTTPSTTNTYACRMSQLTEDFEVHKQYSLNSNNGITNDCAKFEHLEKMGRTLVSSIPGYSTHCDQLVSPTIDWDTISNFTTYG